MHIPVEIQPVVAENSHGQDLWDGWTEWRMGSENAVLGDHNKDSKQNIIMDELVQMYLTNVWQDQGNGFSLATYLHTKKLH